YLVFAPFAVSRDAVSPGSDARPKPGLSPPPASVWFIRKPFQSRPSDSTFVRLVHNRLRMIFIRTTILAVAALAGPLAAQDDPAPAVRRLASTALLAAQEYAIGVRGGTIVLAAEVEEAKLFLKESRRSAEALPPGERERMTAGLDSVIAIVNATGSPDSVSRRVRELTEGLAARTGVELDELPARTPQLARGAELYAANCASCHGDRGLGDGPAGRGLDPAPANLAD